MAIVIEQMSTPYVPIGNDTDDVLVTGDTFEREFFFEEDDAPNDAIDFTGWTFAGLVKDVDGNTVGTMSFNTGDSTGLVLANLTTLPAAGVHEYDVEAVNGPKTKTIQRGPFHTTASIT